MKKIASVPIIGPMQIEFKTQLSPSIIKVRV